tara:strand:- start:490 stop:924 length:435 start_codon:yes stop_codon:yes gene_type:complete
MELKIFGLSCRLEVIIICFIIGFILGGHLLCSCSKIGLQEGMAMMGTALDWDNSEGQHGSWTSKGNDYAKNMGYSESRTKYSQYKGTPVPLAEGEMLMFNNNEFKPECCPSTYTSSTGCACISQEQVNYINERGGNRTMGPAEY